MTQKPQQSTLLVGTWFANWLIHSPMIKSEKIKIKKNGKFVAVKQEGVAGYWIRNYIIRRKD